LSVKSRQKKTNRVKRGLKKTRGERRRRSGDPAGKKSEKERSIVIGMSLSGREKGGSLADLDCE